MKKMVCVVWHDAHAGTETWIHLDDANHDVDPYVVVSIGFLLDEKRGGKPKHVSVAQSWSDDDAVDSVLHIPNAMVRSVVPLKGRRYGVEGGRGKVDEERSGEHRGVSKSRRASGV